MATILSAFIALITLAWGLNVGALDAGPDSLPWALREQGLYLSGMLAIGMMSMSMVLATRPTLLERPLGGMDRIFRLHKWAGILAAVFASLHWLIEMSDDVIESLYRGGGEIEREFGGLYGSLRHAGEELGEFAIYLVLAMIALSLWKRFPYKFWRHLHRAMPVLYLLLAFHAAVLAPPEYWTQAAGPLLALLIAAGSIASVIALSGRIGGSRKVKGIVSAVSSPAPDVTEIVCKLDGDWRGHQAGQFVFLGFDRLEGAHPFTIASADHGDRTLTFQIKALGDYTRQLARRIVPGQAVTVEGPYGRFVRDRRNDRARQIWIAGGIGVTPFLAWLDELRARPETAPAVELHYSTANAAEDPFVGRLHELCAELPSVQLQIHDRAKGDRLTAAQLHDEAASGREGTEVWFCGPGTFRDQLRSSLRAQWGNRLRFNSEAFEMR